MLQIVQLQDGTYKVVIDYAVPGISVHRIYYFQEVQKSDADPMENGEKIILEFKQDK